MLKSLHSYKSPIFTHKVLRSLRYTCKNFKSKETLESKKTKERYMVDITKDQCCFLCGKS